MASQEEMKTAMAVRASGKLATVTPENRVAAYLEKMKPQIALALPRHLTPDRLARIALTTIRTTPKLLECSMESLMASVMQAAQLGLEPGMLGHCYIIPYGKEAQFIIGYRGMIDLARRSGEIQSINVHEVYANDYIKLTYGIEESLEHIPWHLREDVEAKESGALRGAYMVARFKDGGYYVHYMPKAEVDAHRKRSKAANNGPWVTDYIEMVKKTVVRSAWKWLPISIDIARQVGAMDETVKKAIAPDMSDVIDLTPERVTEAPALAPGTVIDMVTGEVLSQSAGEFVPAPEEKQDLYDRTFKSGCDSATWIAYLRQQFQVDSVDELKPEAFRIWAAHVARAESGTSWLDILEGSRFAAEMRANEEPRGPGRPKGSKNVPKTTEPLQETLPIEGE